MLLLDQKWDGFEMKNVSLELHKAAIYRRKGGYKNLMESNEKDDKVFVAFKIDSIPERRPFLLSRDFAFVQPSGRNIEPFQVSLLIFHQLTSEKISHFRTEMKHIGIFIIIKLPKSPLI